LRGAIHASDKIFKFITKTGAKMKEEIKTIEIEKDDEGRSVGDIFNKLDDLSNGFFEESQNFINLFLLNYFNISFIFY